MINLDRIKQQLSSTLEGTNFIDLGTFYKGKVRDNYYGKTINDQVIRIIISTDRLSAFDRNITTIPFKGQVLTQMAKFWFEQTKDIIENHVIDYPHPNVVVGMECEALPMEMIVRGYLTGVTTTSAWYNYERGVRNFCGNLLPEGMKKDQKFEKPILTPSTKAEHGSHDESVSGEELIKKGFITKEDYDYIADVSMKLYLRGVEIAKKQGIILVDTKYEFGKTPDGKIVLIDEIHTPDSSRFWFADEYESRFNSGEEQKKIDKEYLRQWLASQGFVGEGELPVIPDEVRIETARRYIEAFELITGNVFDAKVGDTLSTIESSLQKYKTL